jgi:hypothetical protein
MWKKSVMSKIENKINNQYIDNQTIDMRIPLTFMVNN